MATGEADKRFGEWLAAERAVAEYFTLITRTHLRKIRLPTALDIDVLRDKQRFAADALAVWLQAREEDELHARESRRIAHRSLPWQTQLS